MATTPVDPLQLLQAALTAPENTKEQADLLASLRETLEHHPAPIPILVHTLIRKVTDAEDSLLKRWILDLLHFALGRSTLSIEQRTQMALQLLDPLAQLLDEPQVHFVKITIQCLTSVYPLLFRHLCINRSNPNPWHTLTTCKNRIIDMVWSTAGSVGVRLSAMKFVQRVILVQTRGVQDPRLQKPNDPNISFCPVDHPFISAARLETEGQKLLEGLIATLFSSQDVDLLTALLNSWAALVKQRPAILQNLIPALRSWTPSALEKLPAFSVKSVEKAFRILLVHINRFCVPPNSPMSVQINETLNTQAQRMEAAARDEKQRRDNRKRAASIPAGEPSDAKRPKLESETSNAQNIASTLAAFDFTSLPPSLITDLIIANLEAFTEPALEALVQQYRQQRGATKIPSQPSTSTPPTGTPTPAPSSALPPNVPTGPRKLLAQQAVERSSTPPARATTPVVKVEEPVDPLQMDIDQDELEFEPETLNAQLSGGEPTAEDEQPTAEFAFDGLQAIEFKLPSPRDLPEDNRISLITGSLARVWTGADELPVESLQAGGTSPNEVWMLLLVRLITRVAQPPVDESAEEDSKDLAVQDFYVRQDKLRQKLCDYIMDDFPSRVRLATTWMNEEWYNDQIHSERDNNWRPNYDIWLNQIVASYQTLLDGRDRTFSRFVLDLPAVPPDVLGLLRDLCVDESSDKVTIGFITLRGLVLQRPSLRTEALNILLELTTHPDKKTRAAAINVVKAWVPHLQPMYSMIHEFALQMLRKLKFTPANGHAKPQKEQQQGDAEVSDVTMSDTTVPKENGIHAEGQDEIEGQTPIVVDGEKASAADQEETVENSPPPEEDLVHTPYLPERIELPAQKAQVLQHVELLFALSVKIPELLEELFHAYGQMDITVQEAIQDLITALIKSLGPNNGKLLTLMRNFPDGAESLALRVLTIFTENGRASSTLVALVKALISKRELDARFLIPIIAEMDRADIIRHIPKIVSILNGQAENRNIVRNVFNSIVATSTFGTASSNMPRVRQSELLPPDRLMVLLHQCEKEIGLKSAMEAINICFSMTEIFRSEVLGAVMQQLIDESNLPTLFLRTVIQAVTTYKTLVGFVSTTLLSRLITKKIWTNPPLWEGFIWCAKVTAPSSFNALLQLPKDQLRELVDKQPSLKTSLRDYVTKRAPNKARLAGLLDIFGEMEDAAGTPASAEGSRTGSPALS